MDFEDLQKYWDACDPAEGLGPDDPRNVDIDHLQGRVRGEVWADRLARRVLLTRKNPRAILFTGLKGSGKSTELRRLCATLEQKGRLSVYLDAESMLDLRTTVDVPDLLAVLVDGVERRVLEAEERDPDTALQEGYLARLAAFLKQTDVEFKKAEYQIPSGPKLTAELSTRPTLRARFREVVARQLTTFLAEVHSEIEKLDARAQAAGYTGLFVVLDSLEKLRGIEASFDDVRASAARVFGGGAPYMQLPVPVLYTVPPSVWTLERDVEVMPVIKLRERRTGKADPNGRAALRAIVRQRIPDDALSEILGPEREVVEARLDRIFDASGGYPREVVEVLREMVALPVLPATDDALDRTLARKRGAFQRVLPGESFQWLAELDQKGIPTLSNDAQRRLADVLFEQSAVLAYCNGDQWFGLHPHVRAHPDVAAAIARLAKQSGERPPSS